MNKKYLVYAFAGLAAIGILYKVTKTDLSRFTKQSKIFQTHDEVDEFTAIANSKTERLFELAEAMKFNVFVRGRIIRALDWKDFPGLAEEVSKLYPDGDMLLQVHVGEPALLVTRKTQFTTTGFFRLNGQKYVKWETTAGKVWVIVEHHEGVAQEKEWNQIRRELKELTLQYVESKVPNYKEEAVQIKSSSNSELNEHSIASLLFIKELGERKGKASNVFVYSFAKDLALCAVKKEYSVDGIKWGQEYAKIFPDSQKNKASAIVSCANGGPYSNGDKVLSFEQCMCGSGEKDPFLLADKKSRTRFTHFLTSSFNNDSSDKSSKRMPASE